MGELIANLVSADFFPGALATLNQVEVRLKERMVSEASSDVWLLRDMMASTCRDFNMALNVAAHSMGSRSVTRVILEHLLSPSSLGLHPKVKVGRADSLMVAHFSRHSICPDGSHVSAHGSSLDAEGQPFGEYVGNRVSDSDDDWVTDDESVDDWTTDDEAFDDWHGLLPSWDEPSNVTGSAPEEDWPLTAAKYTRPQGMTTPRVSQ